VERYPNSLDRKNVYYMRQVPEGYLFGMELTPYKFLIVPAEIYAAIGSPKPDLLIKASKIAEKLG